MWLGLFSFCLPQSHHVTFCFTVNHRDKKRMFLWISTGLLALGNVGSIPILVTYAANPAQASWSIRNKIHWQKGNETCRSHFSICIMKWSLYPSPLGSLRIINPNTQITLVFSYWVLYKNLEGKTNHTWGKQVANGLYESISMCSIV